MAEAGFMEANASLPGSAGKAGVSVRLPGRGGLLFGATLGNFLGVTSMVAIPLGVMLVPIAQSTGWSRTAVAGAFTAVSLAQAAMCPLAGRIADRMGTRRTLLAGFLMLGVTLVALALAPAQLALFYALFAIAGIVGTLGSTMVIAKLLAEWFRDRRGFWLGFVGGVGNGLGGMVMPALTGMLVVMFGWRQTFGGIGLFMLVVGLPILFRTMRSPPVEHGAAGTGTALSGHSFGEAMRRPLFWAIFAAVPVGGGALTGVFANTVTILVTQGLAVTSATVAVTIFALVCVIVEPLAGHMLDEASRPRRVALFYAVTIVGLVVLAHATTPAVAMVGAALTGLGLGTEFSVLPYMLARYFGLREMGAIAGIAYAGALVSNAVSPLLLNASFDFLGAYAPGLYAVAGVMALALVVFLILPRFPDPEAR